MSNDQLMRDLQGLFPKDVEQFMDVPEVKALYEELRQQRDEYTMLASAFQSDTSAEKELFQFHNELFELKDRLHALVQTHREKRASGGSSSTPFTASFGDLQSASELQKLKASLGQGSSPVRPMDGSKGGGEPPRPDLSSSAFQAPPKPPAKPRDVTIDFDLRAKPANPMAALLAKLAEPSRLALGLSVVSLLFSLGFGTAAMMYRPAPPKMDWLAIEKKVKEVSSQNHLARDVQAWEQKTSELLEEVIKKQMAFEKDIKARLDKYETQVAQKSEPKRKHSEGRTPASAKKKSTKKK